MEGEWGEENVIVILEDSKLSLKYLNASSSEFILTEQAARSAAIIAEKAKERRMAIT